MAKMNISSYCINSTVLQQKSKSLNILNFNVVSTLVVATFVLAYSRNYNNFRRHSCWMVITTYYSHIVWSDVLRCTQYTYTSRCHNTLTPTDYPKQWRVCLDSCNDHFSDASFDSFRVSIALFRLSVKHACQLCPYIPHVATDCGSKQMSCVNSDKDKVILFSVAMLQQQNDQHSELL